MCLCRPCDHAKSHSGCSGDGVHYLQLSACVGFDPFLNGQVFILFDPNADGQLYSTCWDTDGMSPACQGWWSSNFDASDLAEDVAWSFGGGADPVSVYYHTVLAASATVVTLPELRSNRPAMSIIVKPYNITHHFYPFGDTGSGSPRYGICDPSDGMAYMNLPISSITQCDRDLNPQGVISSSVPDLESCINAAYTCSSLYSYLQGYNASDYWISYSPDTVAQNNCRFSHKECNRYSTNAFGTYEWYSMRYAS